MSNSVVVSLRDLFQVKRMDVAFNIAYNKHKKHVLTLTNKNNRAQLEALVKKVGYSKKAWEVVNKSSRSKWESIFSYRYNEKEIALYIVLALFDSAITDEIVSIAINLDKIETTLRNREEISKQLGGTE